VDYRYNFLLSTFSPEYINVWWMNILALMTLLLSAPVVLLLRRSAVNERRQLRVVVLFTLFTIFMTVPLSKPIWNALRPLQETQFPWRWLSLVSMGIAILTAGALPLLFQSDKNTDRIKRLLIMGAMSVGVVFCLSHVIREAKFLSPRAFANTLAEVRGSQSINYWLPIGANPAAAPMAVEVEATNRAVSVQSWTPESRRFSVAAGSPTEARVRTFYYPHWTARSGEQRLNTQGDKDGVLLVSLPAEAVTVDLVFEEPRRTHVSSAVSLAGVLFIGMLAVPLRRKL
jgi:membrane protease YdiL (CAAX protease family)